MAATLWFYVRDDKRQGPVDFEHLVTMLLAGQIPHNALVWHQGLREWAEADTIEEIAEQLPPPLPQAAKPPRPAAAIDAPRTSAESGPIPTVALSGNSRVDELPKRLEKEPGSRLFAQRAEELRKEETEEEEAPLTRTPDEDLPPIPLVAADDEPFELAAPYEGPVVKRPSATPSGDTGPLTVVPAAASAPTPPLVATDPPPPAATAAPPPLPPPGRPARTAPAADLAALLDEEDPAPRMFVPSQMPPTGSLADTDFPDLIHGLHDRRWTGTIQLNRGRVDSTVIVKEGRLIFATSTNRDERLGELLLRTEKITLRQYYEAGRAIRKGKRLGSLLVEQGALDARDLVKAVVDHTQEVIYSVFQWTEGFYRLREGADPETETITLKLSTANIILEGIRRITAWSRIERGIGGPTARYVRAENYKDRLPEMTLTPQKLLLLGGHEGERDVDTMCRESELCDFEVCRMIWAFRVIGVLTQVPAASPRSS